MLALVVRLRCFCTKPSLGVAVSFRRLWRSEVPTAKERLMRLPWRPGPANAATDGGIVPSETKPSGCSTQRRAKDDVKAMMVELSVSSCTNKDSSRDRN